MKPPQIVAEIGCNHQGDFETAKRMIRIAADFCGIHVIKFQKRDVEAIADKTRPHPNPALAFGPSYYEHRKALEFSVDQHKELKDLCVRHNVAYAVSVFDEQSLKDAIFLGPAYIKFGSAVNQRFDLLSYAIQNWRGQIHVSLGMTMRDEVARLFQFFEDRSAQGRLVLYHCVTGYPLEATHTYLGEILHLQKAYGGRCRAIAYSGHHQGIALDVMAYTMGAEIIERHFTLNRTWKGSDHAASIEPDGMRKLVKYLWDAYLASPQKGTELPECEKEERRRFKGAQE